MHGHGMRDWRGMSTRAWRTDMDTKYYVAEHGRTSLNIELNQIGYCPPLPYLEADVDFDLGVYFFISRI